MTQVRGMEKECEFVPGIPLSNRGFDPHTPSYTPPRTFRFQDNYILKFDHKQFNGTKTKPLITLSVI